MAIIGTAKCTQKSPAPPVPRPGGAGLGHYRNRDGRRCGWLRRPRGQPDGQGVRENTSEIRVRMPSWTGNSCRLADQSAGLPLPVRARRRLDSPKYCCMRITFLGHAGLFVETRHGSVLCDPWFTPAYFGSWFPFPRNDRLDPAAFGRPDFLYVSHLHRDHFDPEFLGRHVAKGRPGPAPGLPDAVPRGGAARPRVQPVRRAPAHGDAGRPRRPRGHDLRHDRTRRRAPRRLGAGARRRRDARAEPERRPAGRSGAAPGARSVRRALRAVLRRDLVPDRLRLPGRRSTRARARQAREPDGTRAAVHRVGEGRARVPVRGAAVLPRRRARSRSTTSTTTDEHLPRPDGVPRRARPQRHRQRAPRRSRIGDRPRPGRLHGPAPRHRRGSRPAVSRQGRVHRGVSTRLGRLAHRRARALVDRARAISSRTSQPGSSRSCSRAPITSAGIAGNVVLDVGDAAICLDFVESTVRAWAGEDYVYKLDVDRRLVTTLVDAHVEDWVNSLFLSCRFRAARPGPFNEYVMTFFKALRHRTHRLRRAELPPHAVAPTSSSSATVGASSATARTGRPTSRVSPTSPTACSRARCTTGSSTWKRAAASRATTATCAASVWQTTDSRARLLPCRTASRSTMSGSASPISNARSASTSNCSSSPKPRDPSARRALRAAAGAHPAARHDGDLSRTRRARARAAPLRGRGPDAAVRDPGR